MTVLVRLVHQLCSLDFVYSSAVRKHMKKNNQNDREMMVIVMMLRCR